MSSTGLNFCAKVISTPFPANVPSCIAFTIITISSNIALNQILSQNSSSVPTSSKIVACWWTSTQVTPQGHIMRQSTISPLLQTHRVTYTKYYHAMLHWQSDMGPRSRFKFESSVPVLLQRLHVNFAHFHMLLVDHVQISGVPMACEGSGMQRRQWGESRAKSSPNTVQSVHDANLPQCANVSHHPRSS